MRSAKRFTGLLLALLLLMTCLPVPAGAAEVIAGSNDWDNLQWALYSDGLLTVSGSGKMTFCDIEASVPWHNYRDQIRTVRISGDITSITPFAFKDCYNLTSVEIPDSVTVIEQRAFYGCSKLRYAELPEGLTSIGRFAFFMCENLRDVNFGDRLTSIGEYAYNMCRSLSTVVIPAGVTQIGSYAFQACSNLAVIRFLGNAPSFNSNMFPGQNTVTCYYPEGNASWNGVATGGSAVWLPFAPGDSMIPAEQEPVDEAPVAPLAPEGGIVESGSCGADVGWKLYESGLMVISGNGPMEAADWSSCADDFYAVIIEEGVTSVADYAFMEAESLIYVRIPASVTWIGEHAFACCYNLDHVVFTGGAPEIGYQTFFDTSVTCYYPAGTWPFGARLDYGGMYVNWKPYVGTVNDPSEPEEPKPSDPEPSEPDVPEDTLLDSGSCGVDVYWKLNADGVLTVSGSGAMEDYPEEYPGWDRHGAMLTEVVIEEGITGIGDYAFWGYRNITKVRLPESLRRIGVAAFANCEGLIEITIPSGVTNLADYAFGKCSSLDLITFQGSAPEFGLTVFADVDAMAVHPTGDSTWNDSTRGDHGGQISWDVDGKPVALELLKPPDNCVYVVGDWIDLSGIRVKAIYDEVTSVELKEGVMTRESGDTSAVGVHNVVASYQGLTVTFPIYVHSSRRTETLDSSLWPESAHNYGNLSDESRYITYGTADRILLTFSADTYTEPGYDFICVFDGQDREIVRFTGSGAAEATVEVPGSVARIQLLTDSSGTAYGYSLSDVTAEIVDHPGPQTEAVEATCHSEGRTPGIDCSICGKTVGAQRIPMLEHQWGGWLPDAQGGMSRECGLCGDHDYLAVERLFTSAGDSEYEELTMEEIRALYDTVDWDMEASYAVTPSPRAPYVIGRLSDKALDNLTAQTNFFRRLAKLDRIKWHESLTHYAQAASMVNAATETLSHFPAQPSDMDDSIYYEGYEGASSSNLAWGTHMGLMDSIPGYMDDSDSSNIAELGHRRWLLNPGMGFTGFGSTSSGPRSHYHATYVFDNSNYENTDFDFTAYPGGNRIFPSEFFESHMAWSVQLNPDTFKTPVKDRIQVTLTRESDGKQWVFNNQTQNGSAGFFNVDTVNYGYAYAVIFRPEISGTYEGAYRVMVTGLQAQSGEIAAIEYTVDFQSLAAMGHEHTPVVRNRIDAGCETSGYTGDTYCGSCGELLEEGRTVDPLGHAMEDGTCTRCGHREWIAGDVDNSGAVDLDDAIYLLYHILVGDMYPVSGNCDFNCDGKLDIDDPIYLLFYILMGEEFYPLP